MSLRTHVTLIISAQDVKQHALVIPVLCRTTFAVVNKGANDSITITWTVTVS